MNKNWIKLYIADYVELGLEDTWREMFDMLHEGDRERIGRFKFDADRIRGTTGAALIRKMAAEAFPGEEIRIERTELGKPYLFGHEGFEFSLSHSGDMIVLAVSPYPVGADVEIVKDKDWKMFRRYLKYEEMSMIECSDDPEGAFFEVWTVKEAFSKEEGQGLRILDDRFSIDYIRKQIEYKDKTLYFSTISHTARDRGYKISVCSPLPTEDTEYIRLDCF